MAMTRSTLVDRAAFLRKTARPITISKLETRDRRWLAVSAHVTRA
jgi:hypothetical protein